MKGVAAVTVYAAAAVVLAAPACSGFMPDWYHSPIEDSTPAPAVSNGLGGGGGDDDDDVGPVMVLMTDDAQGAQGARLWPWPWPWLRLRLWMWGVGTGGTGGTGAVRTAG